MALTWALSDGRAGNARQAEALARALQSEGFQAIHLQPKAPWRWAAPRQLPGAQQAFGAPFDRQLQQPPALAIGCGRQAALATRLLRGRGSRSVQILDPRLDPRHWDLLVVPEHDALRGGNVLTLLGSLHPVDDAWLAAGRAAFPA
ncbi:ELM1/GtrOC1 family putative glycosyltransferase, partial [Xanthomonas oryzae]|uniref:ELM1/GtrOC1 family putative glycosyltransferase n=1 Tax=Xanthomonas oryzae TaxID=347 RepID=UPI0004973A7D